MPSAAIDIGSNTVRLLVANTEECRVAPLRYEQAITRLARGLSSTGMLGKESIEETAAVLLSYKKIADEYGAFEIEAAGTGALREANNSREFIRTVRELTGISIEVISGRLEAELTALGVTRSLPGAKQALILDIGGASTELAVVRDGRIQNRQTIPEGVVKLLEHHVTADPPTRRELDELEASSSAISREFTKEMPSFADMNKEILFISTAGTPTTLAAMDLGLKEYDHLRVHGHRITIGKLESMLKKLAAVPASERVGMGCLDSGRADLIIPGLILTIGIMKAFGFHEMTVSDQGLLEGLLLRSAGCGH